ncbi:hypothetical protein RHS01_01199 [Rhizoctonia solani]|uniref:RNase H type-1 domain-containing protein n=1 Tax=Rhizoctonia solani TaxID=456999 RepID=A0A8H7IMF2_9AGAM|nr:hypothetical protein RHS01_01199 [Rhizoctonia solani]
MRVFFPLSLSYGGQATKPRSDLRHSLDSPTTSQDQRQNKNAQKIQDSPLDDPETASQHRSQPGQLRDQPSIQHPTPGPQAAQSLRAPGGTDEAIADESTLKPTVKIFSDGSMVGGNVGAAAVLIREGKEEVVARKYVGSDREHEVYEAEVVGLILGLELLARERGAGEAIFFIDNQAVLLTLKAGHTDKLGYLYAHMDEGIDWRGRPTQG